MEGDGVLRAAFSICVDYRLRLRALMAFLKSIVAICTWLWMVLVLLILNPKRLSVEPTRVQWV